MLAFKSSGIRVAHECLIQCHAGDSSPFPAFPTFLSPPLLSLFSLPPNSTHQPAGLSSALSLFQMTINPNSRWSRQCNTEYSESNKEEGGLWNRWEFLVFVRAAPITARKSARPKFQPKVGPILTQRHTKPPSLSLPCRPRRFLARFRELMDQSRAHMPNTVPCRRFFPFPVFPAFLSPPLLSLFPSRQTQPTSWRVSARLSLFFK